MIAPDKVCDEAKKKEDENYRFRTYLKTHAKEEELDDRFNRLHNELFAEYDCSECRNCCKMYKGTLEEQDVMQAMQVFNILLPLGKIRMSSLDRVDSFLFYQETVDRNPQPVEQIRRN